MINNCTIYNCKEQSKEAGINQSNIDILLDESQIKPNLGVDVSYSFYKLTSDLSDTYGNFLNLITMNGSAGYDFMSFKFINNKWLKHQDYDFRGFTGGAAFATAKYSIGFQFKCSTPSSTMCLWYGGSSTNYLEILINTSNKIIINMVKASVLTSFTSVNEISVTDWNSFIFQMDGTTPSNCWFELNSTSQTLTSNLRDTVSNNFIQLGNNLSNNYYTGLMRNYRIVNKVLGLDEIENLRNQYLDPSFYLINNKTKSKVNISSNVTKMQTNGIALKKYPVNTYVSVRIPQMQDGLYTLECVFGNKKTNKNLRIINNISCVEEYFEDDFQDFSKTSNNWFLANKKWGGTNGGVSANNIKINNSVVFNSLGDLYNGSVKGVDTLGHESGFNKRIGACIVSKKYFGPGVYEFEAKWPNQTGVVFAFWTFHYEEIYPNDERYTDFLNEGLHESGDVVNGYYIVRNHEIDIETPTALKTDFNQESASFNNMRVNSWIGELRNWNVPNNDVPTSDPMYSATNDPSYWSEYTDNFINSTQTLNDGQVHIVKFDWDITQGYIKFYVDGALVHTITSHIPNIAGRVWIGTWFPSASTKWAGSTANWNSQECELRSFKYTPHLGQSYRKISESYPSDGLLPISNKNT